MSSSPLAPAGESSQRLQMHCINAYHSLQGEAVANVSDPAGACKKFSESNQNQQHSSWHRAWRRGSNMHRMCCCCREVHLQLPDSKPECNGCCAFLLNDLIANTADRAPDMDPVCCCTTSSLS